MKHVVCYSGGHSSALVAIEVSRKYGNADLVLLNHDMAAHVEDAGIKRFKREVAAYIGVPVTYANRGDGTEDQFDVCIQSKGFKGGNNVLCTTRLKTEPFWKWLKDNVPDKNCVCYYGFDATEKQRVTRRVGIMANRGYKTDYPLLWTERTIHSTKEIGIEPPLTYSTFKHANCIGCLKAGWQHWYVVYCTRKDIWEKAKNAEEEIGHAIHKDAHGLPVYLAERERVLADAKSRNRTNRTHFNWKVLERGEKSDSD